MNSNWCELLGTTFCTAAISPRWHAPQVSSTVSPVQGFRGPCLSWLLSLLLDNSVLLVANQNHVVLKLQRVSVHGLVPLDGHQRAFIMWPANVTDALRLQPPTVVQRFCDERSAVSKRCDSIGMRSCHLLLAVRSGPVSEMIAPHSRHVLRDRSLLCFLIAHIDQAIQLTIISHPW